MSKFVFLYNGGKLPESEDEGAAVMKAWNDWFDVLGSAVVDAGNPTGARATVAADGAVTQGAAGANPVNGYSIIEAGSLDDALIIAKGSPHLDAGGSVEVGELLDM
jgi:hypothetical protein